MIEKLCDNIIPFLDPYVVQDDRGAPWLDCRDNYEWYFSYGKLLKPKSYLEVGVKYGYSVLSVLFGSESTEVVSLYDNESDKSGSLDIARKSISKAFPDVKTKLNKVDTGQIDKVNEDILYDMIHIDGNHKPLFVKHDIDIFWPVLRPGGIMIMDDMISLAGPRTIPLFAHIMPWLYDSVEVSSWTMVNNYNKQVLIRKTRDS